MATLFRRHNNLITKNVIALILSLLFLVVPAYAQDNMRGLTLSPLRTEMSIDPGVSANGSLVLTNSTDNIINVDLSAEEFGVINQQYDYEFKPVSNIAKWISFKFNNVKLSAGEIKTLPFTVNVPLDTEPGGRYISLFASTNSDYLASGANLRQRVASLLYVTVNGDVTRNGNLISLSSPWFVADNGSNWSMALQNTGTTHFNSRYNISITDIFGHDEISNLSRETLILPSTVRLLSDSLPPLKFPGIYKIMFTIGLGDKPSAVETHWLIFIPVWLIVAVFILLILLLVITKYLITKHKNRVN